MAGGLPTVGIPEQGNSDASKRNTAWRKGVGVNWKTTDKRCNAQWWPGSVYKQPGPGRDLRVGWLVRTEGMSASAGSWLHAV